MLRHVARATAVCAALALVAGCSGRERTNPFDPQNPDTQGRPRAFLAVAQDGSVTLSWAPLAHSGLAGYRLWRRGPGEAGFTPIGGAIPRDSTSYEDLGLTNDSTYVYRLAFVLADSAVGPAAQAEARPGAGRGWVADAGADVIVRVTPDARHRVFFLPGLDGPAEVEVEPASGRIWGSSRTLGRVAVWNPDGMVAGFDDFFYAPSALAPLPGSTEGWVAEERSGDVTRWSPTQGVLGRSLVPGLPADLEVVPGATEVWVADRPGRRLLRVSPAGVVTTVELPARPWRLAADGSTGDVWVSYTEAGMVERRDASGALLARAEGLAAPFAIAVDSLRARAWVSLADGGAVVALDPDARVFRRVPGIREPRGLAVDARSGEVWVTSLGFGDGSGSLWLLSLDGAVLSRQDGFVRPVDVALDPASSKVLP